MSSFIAIILPDEAAAAAATQALDSLHAGGSMTLFGRSLVVREDSGTLAIREAVAAGASGAPVGALVEALAGAAAITAGVAPGASHRGLVGADAVEEYLAALTPGCAAILAEVDEHWLAPADAAMAGLGGLVIRRRRDGIADGRLCREITVLEAELQALEQESESASYEARRAIRRRADATRRRLAAASRMAAGMLGRLDAETSARLAVLEGQLEQLGTHRGLRVGTEARIGKALAVGQAEAAQRRANLLAAQALARAAIGSETAED
jgi:uncharacterized membrane protein